MSTYEFKVGDKGKTRSSNDRYEVIAVGLKGKLNNNRSVVAIITHANGEAAPVVRYADGRLYDGSEINNFSTDLMPPTPKKWLVKYTLLSTGDKYAITFQQEESALNRYASVFNRIAYTDVTIEEIEE